MIKLGVDEVGRGSWAGPLVVGAVVFRKQVEGLTDSKLLSSRKRKELSEVIKASGASVGLGWVSAKQIDNIGLSRALEVATKSAIRQINTEYNEIIIDGTVNFLKGTTKERYVTNIKKADLLISEVSAASIMAKVARDEYMQNLDDDKYDFFHNVGYGTRKHQEGLKLFGVCEEHRTSFKPIRELLGLGYEVKTDRVTSTLIGNKAESKVCELLESENHTIIARNWKNRYCEIDIVSICKNEIFFTEVKYRKNSSFGDGLSAVTDKKLKKMRFAAELFLYVNHIESKSAKIAVASVSGRDFTVEDCIYVS